MANLGKKWICFSCSAKFYDFGKPEATCPKCGTSQKDAPAKPRAIKKEKVAIQIEDDFGAEPDLDAAGEDGIVESFGITGARAEGVDPGDLNMDDYDE
ncbi:FYDLN acid domain-containing protein [Holophaga foetida]|uniref:FYDLN acid domain-containing protein n=1 Tax=Holophaga foetida TaxID=35839 RepID=UPI0002473305|nr:FYDLN acid domain-containing protein [Holophaga foetida]